MAYDVAIIGTGPEPGSQSRDGYAMAYRHAPGYERLEDTRLVACADIAPTHARAFASRFGLDDWFEDHRTMLEVMDPDIVSICVPPSAHAELVEDCAVHPSVRAIHCEKPMADRWDDCQRMVSVCESNDVQLTIDHQRRLAAPVVKTRQLLDDGAIGELRRFEWSEVNLFDAGSHLFDLCDHLTGGGRPSWALAAVATDEENRWFGALNDVHAIATWGYDDGVVGLASTAEGDRPTVVDPYLRVVGDEGAIEIQAPDGPPLRIDTGDGWREVDTGGESVYRPAVSITTAAANRIFDAIPGVNFEIDGEPTHYERAIEHAVSCLDRGAEPVFSGRNVLRGTELIFACYESARRQDRVELPLTIEGNPLETLVAERQVAP